MSSNQFFPLMPIDTSRSRPSLLTIAGLDPSGGAGVIADVETFLALGCAPTVAITSVTYQNSERMFGADHQSAASVRAQIEAISADHRVTAVKTGMLPTREIVAEVARLVREGSLPAPVVDPVIRSSSGYELIEQAVLEVLLSNLVPQACVITPNIPEAEQITGFKIVDEEGMRRAAEKIRELGARAVLIKGGHLPREVMEAIDVLDNDGQITVFRGEWVQSTPLRGTGCRLSSAIAASLAQGATLEQSVNAAKGFVRRAIALNN